MWKIVLAVALITLYFTLILKPDTVAKYTVQNTISRTNHFRTIDIALADIQGTKTTVSTGQFTTESYRSKDGIIHSSMAINTAKTKGTILVSLYAEQQVGAAMNMFSLQKWAKSVNVSVVEPFVQNSMLRLPIVFSHRELAAKLRFRDYFDINAWNNRSISMNGSTLISWETFIDQAPKKYIFVAVVNSLKKEKRLIYVDDEIMEQKYCNDTFHSFIKRYSFYINWLQTKLSRRVCLSFYKTAINIDEFTNVIYGNNNSSDVIVWFQIWKGFSKNNRVRVHQEHFHRSPATLAMLHTSKRILDDSQRYVREFLKSESGKYTAISIRTVVRGKYLPRNNHSSFFHNCIKELGSVINFANITDSKIFVALDLGRFGDSVVEKFINRSIIKNIKTEIFQTVYNNSLTMWKWEQSFIQATKGITDSGYIAAMQRTIVENGQCLVLFGGRSNFQRSLLLTYKEKHINESCIYEVCYEK